MKVKKRTLLLLASIVWLIAGFNIIRIGILSYTGHVTVVNILLSALVFAVFWSMVFYKLEYWKRNPITYRLSTGGRFFAV